MAAKMFVVFCISTLLVQSISGQCIGRSFLAEELPIAGAPLAYGPGLANNLAYGAAPFGAYGGLAPGYGPNAFTPSSGGAFPVTSSSPISPTGITVVSENAIEGVLSAVGELPFLSAVAFEGALPTGGAGGINYGCGGAIGIVSEGLGPAYGPPIAPAAAMAPGRLGYGAGYPAPGFAAPGLAPAGLAGPAFGYNGLGGFGSMY